MVARGPLGWLYRRLGRHYPRAFVTLEMLSAFPVTAGAIFLFSFYYEGSWGEYLLLSAIVLGLLALMIAFVLARTYPLLAPIDRWIAGGRDADTSAQAWMAGVSLPLEMVRRKLPAPALVHALASCVAGVVILDLSWLAIIPLLVGALITVGYASILHYLALEQVLRPVLLDINEDVSPRLRTQCSAIPMRWRLVAALPMINLITGLIVAALTSSGGGAPALGADVLIALGVAFTVSLELSLLLARSILRPIADLRRATDAVAEGDFERSVPITTADEIGELAASFNQMLAGLRERERIRDAFGTYLDRDVAEYILSDDYSESGFEAEVSILVCDVVDFTRIAAERHARDVVGELNALFERVVPIVRRHGGHVDKFLGDGVLAVFGIPARAESHADEAVRAGCELVREVNHGGGEPVMRVGVGINSGRVIAGAIGGGGRLNFSVIGDAVNVAARVESATRMLGVEILVTEATRELLSDPGEMVAHGPVELKGLEDAVSLWTPERPPEPRPGALAGAERASSAPLAGSQ